MEEPKVLKFKRKNPMKRISASCLPISINSLSIDLDPLVQIEEDETIKALKDESEVQEFETFNSDPRKITGWGNNPKEDISNIVLSKYSCPVVQKPQQKQQKPPTPLSKLQKYSSTLILDNSRQTSRLKNYSIKDEFNKQVFKGIAKFLTKHHRNKTASDQIPRYIVLKTKQKTLECQNQDPPETTCHHSLAFSPQKKLIKNIRFSSENKRQKSKPQINAYILHKKQKYVHERLSSKHLLKRVVQKEKQRGSSFYRILRKSSVNFHDKQEGQSIPKTYQFGVRQLVHKFIKQNRRIKQRKGVEEIIS